MADQVMITTEDNPYDPFTQYTEWNTWDISHGYHSTSLLARVVISSDELSEQDQSLALRAGIDEIVRHNATGVHTYAIREV